MRIKAVLLVYLLGAIAASAQTQLQWIRLPATGAQPAPRTGATIIEHVGGILLFGGLVNGVPQNDLWSYGGGVWRQITPSGTPPAPRFGHIAIDYAPSTIMYIDGGKGSGNQVLDICAYDYRRNNWVGCGDGTPESDRYGHSTVYDFPRAGFITTHGFTSTGASDRTWRWSGDTDITPAGARPSPRGYHRVVLDEAGRQMFLFGGCGIITCPLGDFWSFDLSGYDLNTFEWKPRNPGAVPARHSHGMAFSPTPGRLVIFGGMGTNGVLGDTWEYNLANDTWTALSPSGEAPSARAGHASASTRNGALFFGGETANGLSNELWLLARVGNSVVNGAAFQSGTLAPGSIVSLFGANLAPGTAGATGIPLPTRLLETTIEVNGNLAPLLFVSPSQINFLVPWESSAGLGVATVTLNGAAMATLPYGSLAPGIFTSGQDGKGQGAVLIGGTASPAASVGTAPGARPVRRGESIEIYATGLGPVDKTPRSDSAAPADPLSRMLRNPVVTLGGIPAPVTFAGLAPGFAGLYQVNVQVPENAPSGTAVPLLLSVEGVAANYVTIAVE